MISIVVFKWSKPGYRSVFSAENVNVTRRMCARHFTDPHRFICVTDDPRGLDPQVEVIPLWGDFANVPNPTWANGPSCYRRLKVFSKWFQDQVTDRIVVLDLDIVITGDLRPLWNRPEEFLIWRPDHHGVPMCASMFMLRKGACPQVWDQFDHIMSPQLAGNAGFRGSDQAWITYCLGKDTPGWTTADGVYGYKDNLVKGMKDMRKAPNVSISPRFAKHIKPVQNSGALPADARMVIFTGKPDPWDKEAISLSPWILEHYK